MQKESVIASFDLRFDPRLMEEAVLLSMAGHPEEPEFRRLRDAIYRMGDRERHNRRFDELHQRWFSRLRLASPVLRALREKPFLLQRVRGCLAARAVFCKDEGADLHGTPPTILLKLRPESLLQASLLDFLRHELTHLMDMVDPAFGYRPQLPPSQAGPTHDELVRNRYRVLWDVWIDGRLLRQGLAAEPVRELRRREFEATFPMAVENLDQAFSHWFDTPFHTHQEMVDFALRPGTREPGRSSPSGRCALCGFPSFDLIAEGRLPAQTRTEILRDFPEWTPSRRVCRQCSDLYQSRGLSQAAEDALPRV